ncbi:hypothetical protein GW920_01940 [Candidatus Falkowbacteria bacterium]|uniref:Uncharacterized protein n=1 Tax=Candidatus Falkowbacteria bacterium CG10_big_fil_rev_8_21_14_0_10_37_18 TaxID=1974562 RepID=A0A2H0V8F0_9BACT|nr:hypothetical protein [Candidatus Falkowbacteria bacterium]NCQ13013.1 hypothetical protein [Candidatus Falkowbacteria bacterium]PIR95387.1 MAG: hypothetical protein COT93_02745 [Candidatus Falkowbacteria bacterium CG10_big_fil_rev_8_21_14_0_10_37_18]
MDIKKIGKKFIVNKKLIFTVLPLLSVLGIFFAVPTVNAGSRDWAYTVVSFLLGVFVSALGLILVLVLQGLTLIASYQHFIDSRAVVLGWVMVRDICNMFFVIVLMVIAFGTILNLEDYNYKKLLPKLILMAVLINFSKTICGLLIDVTQVVMLTFVNAFKDIGAANFTDIFGITSILTLAKNGAADIDGFTAAAAYILGFLYLLIAIVVITTMMMMLAMRLVMIWIYVVLSPAAYLLAAVPGGQSYSQQWWTEFTKNLIVGPVLAFFIWLSLSALQVDNTTAQYSANDSKAQEEIAYANTEASKPSALIKYVIAIGMLVGGLMVSQKIGGAAGELAGKGMGALQKGQSLATGAAVGAALWTAKRPLKAAGWANDRFLQGKGIMDLNLSRVVKQWNQRSEEKKQQRYTQGKVKADQRMSEGGTIKGALAMSALGEDTFDHLTTWRGIKQTIKGGKRMQAAKDKLKSSPEFGQAKFEEEYASLDDPNDRLNKIRELSNSNLAINGNQEKLKYAQQNSHTVYSDDDKRQARDKVEEYQKKIDNNLPMTNYNAKMAEQSAIQKEYAKLSMTSDSDELLRLLKSALQSQDTARASAIFTKMTKDGNDNEFTKALDKFGDTGWKGLQRVMSDIANPNSKNYGGFNEQQALSLGASLSELNKSNNHWEAVGGFEMEDGQWHMTDEDGAANISLSESGKKNPQDLTKSGDHLAYGKYVKGKYQLTASGVVRLKTIAGEGNLKNVEGGMNESTVTNILPEIADVIEDAAGNKTYTVKDQYKDHFDQAFVNAMVKRIGKISNADPLKELSKVKGLKFT